ncbi:phosphate/phosphite/phosphonate ABC transporter substrate-binding protein [Salirhabdus salicampi]|uniref:phosphate/phosphite/phosphonate ABC transporter substrate-binding protein n=1 Tax=Salirhabdus salicampi TaxID=476102 RepID=UPI0020C418F4|nr:phosphate/phosphite/phosphonate ABC transporter substrate-binding protein [Salirhabdus salicampi]MCP8616228.1 phosphate/phosphite/phosphonate ABC transporter substrate-binding protein [Salirhabdus salicampi]
MKKFLFGIVLAMTLVFTSACGNNAEDDAFTIGVIPAQTKGSMEDAMNKLQEELSEGLERTVKVEIYPDYNGVVEAMNYDKIDMAYFGPLTYVVANHESGAKAIITQLVDGEPYYYSYMITHIDQPWDSLDEMIKDSGQIEFAFGDINSTSGSLIPGIELENRGVFQSEEEHEFKSVRYTGSHDATAIAVQNQGVDVGAIDSAIFDELVADGDIDGEQIKVIWKSDKLFQYPWAVHSETPKETIEQLQEIFLNIEDEDILGAFGASGFTTATDNDYEAIKQAAVKQGIIKE